MRYTPLNLLGGTNVDDNRPWTVEDTVNYIPQVAPSAGTRTPHEFRDAPGLKPYVKLPSTGGGETPEVLAGPIRGSHDCEGTLFVVSGSKLYQITPTGIAIPLGTIPGTQRVNMAHNQIVGGNQLIVTTGTPNGYTFNTYTKVFARIPDPGYPGGGSVDYIDTYIVSVEPFGRYWFWSAQADATNYNTLDRTEAEADPDAIVGLAVNAFEVVVFGKQTVEFFYNAGGINGNAFKSKRVVNGHGCAARDSIVKLDNTLFWLGVDGIVYRLNGYQAQPVTSPQFTQAIAGKNWAKAFAFSYEDQGHVIYYITFPDGQTFGFDVTTGLTVRRESYGLNRWRLNTLTSCNGRWVGGDFQSGKLYELDWRYPMEGEGDALVRERVTGVTADNQNKIEVPLLELLFETGSPQVEPVLFVDQPAGPSITGTAPDGVRLLPYGSFSYTTSGGTGVRTVTRRPGSIDIPGLTFTDGTWTGTPTTEFTEIGYVDYVQVIRVTDENGLWSEITDTIRITAALLGFTTENYLFTGPPSALVESIPTTLGAITARSMSISPNTLYVAAGSVNAPYVLVKKRREDGTGYNLMPSFDDMPASSVESTAFSPDGKYFAIRKDSGTPTIYVYRITEDDDWVMVDSAVYVSGGGGAITWSPNSARLCVPMTLSAPQRGFGVYPFDQDTETLGTPVYSATVETAQAPNRMNWSPNGNFLAQDSNNNLVIWDARVSPIIKLDAASPVRASGRGALWSPGGDYVYSVTGGGGANPVAIYGFSGSSLSAAVIPTDQPGAACQDSSISADGGSLAIGMATISPSVLVYEVLGSDLQAYASQPATSQNVSQNVVFTGSGLSE